MLLITDRMPQPGVDPGFERRYSAVREWAAAGGFATELAVLAKDSSRRRRIQGALWPARAVRDAVSSHDVVIILALNAPHMLALSPRIGRPGKRVIVDLCDSIRLTGKSSAVQRDNRSWAKAVTCRLLLPLLPSATSVSYISQRDLDADTPLNMRQSALVIPQSPPAELEGVDEFVGPPQRIVVPADFNAPHNQVAFQWLIDGVREGKITTVLPIHLYGPSAPDLELPSGIEYRGWARDLADVYRGRTAVFAPNIEAAGMQNKLWEAMHAGRPIIIGEAAAGDYSQMDGVWTFKTREEMYNVFPKLQSYSDKIPKARFTSSTALSLEQWLALPR